MKTSFISNQAIPKGESVQGSDIRAGIYELILKEHPGFGPEHFISLTELNFFAGFT